MSINGSGTLDSPYEVTTITEFREKAVEPGVTIKLMNDLLCDEEYPKWYTLNGNSSNKPTVDLNGFHIVNIYLQTNQQCMNNMIFKNGQILNIYEYTFDARRVGCGCLFSFCEFENVAITGKLLVVNDSKLFDTCKFSNCYIDLYYGNIKNNISLSCYQNCNFFLTYSNWYGNTLDNRLFWVSGTVTVDQCRFDGTASTIGRIGVGDNYMTFTFCNNILAFKTSSGSRSLFVTTSYRQALVVQNNIYNSDDATFNGYGGVTGLPFASMTDADKLIDANFPCYKVIKKGVE